MIEAMTVFAAWVVVVVLGGVVVAGGGVVAADLSEVVGVLPASVVVGAPKVDVVVDTPVVLVVTALGDEGSTVLAGDSSIATVESAEAMRVVLVAEPAGDAQAANASEPAAARQRHLIATARPVIRA